MFVFELIEFIVAQFLSPAYVGQVLMERVARVGEKSFGGRPEGKNRLEGLSLSSWDDDIKINLEEMSWCGVNWVNILKLCTAHFACIYHI